MSHSKRIAWLVVSLTVVAVMGILVQSALAEPAVRIDPNEVDGQDAASVRDPVISNPSPYEPVTKCKQCHIELTDQWISSAHGMAYRDRVFRFYYREYQDYVRSNWNKSTEIIDEQGRKRRVPKIPRVKGRNAASVVVKGQIKEENQYDIKVKNPREYAGIPCLKCHAPGAFYTGDDEPFQLENSKDGVFCDFCHTIVDYTEDLGYEIFGTGGLKTTPDNPRGERSKSAEKRCKGKGQWNTYTIVCVDGVIKLAVNGKFVNGISRAGVKKGYICLESEGAEIHFRNVRLMELSPGITSAEQTAPVVSQEINNQTS